MNSYFKKSFNIVLILLILILCLNFAFASDNVTCTSIESNSSFEQESADVNVDVVEFQSNSSKTDTIIEVNDIESYYKENTNLAGYLKDINGTPIKNRQLNIFLNGKTYNKTTDDNGGFALKLNLKPNTYKVSVRFLGDNDFNSTESSSSIKIKKASLAIKINNFNTYEHSDRFFKAKVYNKITNNPVCGIRVAFKVYSSKTKKYSYYYATTNEKGVASLNRNLKAGSYRISVQIKDSKNRKYISFKNSNKKVTMKVKPTKEFGCCSFYLQISASQSIAGFRRDSTEAADIFIKNVKWHGKAAVKQYKSAYGYFFHSITTADGWMVGNGGIDDGSICKSIEKLAGDMVKSKKIKKSNLKKIQKYKKYLNFGHFSIKAPNGNFAVVFKNKIITGKLKPGEYISVPNVVKDYRKGYYSKFSTDPVKAAVKVGATDKYGINRRDITLFHWKSETSATYKTTSQVKVYAANDNGKMVKKSTAHLKDNIKYKNKFFSKNKLPKSPDFMLLGTHNFGNIDKLIKTPTTISAPDVSCRFNQTGYFKVTVKNKKTKKAIGKTSIKINVSGVNFTKVYRIKTDSNGVAKFNTKELMVGNYTVTVYPGNSLYLVSGKSKIEIRE